MKKMIIMGASSGIGLAVAEAFASRGVKVGLAARHTEKFHELKKKYPDTVEYESIDITHKNAPVLLYKLIEKMDGMDIYFHVSGIGYENPPMDPNIEAEVINTNAAGFARMLSAAYNYFKSTGRKGRIAAVTSVAGTKGIGRLAAYSASKRCASTYMVALEQLAITEKTNVSFTDIRPGWIRTPLLKDDQKYPMEMSLEQTVPLIIKAIVKAPRVAVIDWRWNLLTSIWEIIPDNLWIRMKIPVSESKCR